GIAAEVCGLQVDSAREQRILELPMRSRLPAALLAMALAACGARSSPGGVPDAGPPDADVPDAGPPDAGVPDAGPPDAGPALPILDPSASLVRAQDINPDPNVVEVNLAASNATPWDL